MAGFFLLCDVLYRDVDSSMLCCWPEKEGNGDHSFRASDHLNRPSSWSPGLLERLRNLLLFVGHIKLVLQCKFGAPYCLHSLVMFKRSLGAKLIKIVKNANCARLGAWGSHGRHLGCLKSFKTSFFSWISQNLHDFWPFLASYCMYSSLPFLSFPYLAVIVASRLLSLYGRYQTAFQT